MNNIKKFANRLLYVGFPFMVAWLLADPFQTLLWINDGELLASHQDTFSQLYSSQTGSELTARENRETSENLQWMKNPQARNWAVPPSYCR